MLHLDQVLARLMTMSQRLTFIWLSSVSPFLYSQERVSGMLHVPMRPCDQQSTSDLFFQCKHATTRPRDNKLSVHST